MSGIGFMGRAAFFLNEDEEGREALAEKYRSDAVLSTITLILAIATELDSSLGLNLSDRIRFLWTVLIEYWDEAKDFFERRYRGLLEAPCS